MSKYKIIDTFPQFLDLWASVKEKPTNEQIESWASKYMSCWPELLEKQLEDYSGQNVDWRQIAREKVFPFLNDRLPAMKTAHKNLLESCVSVYSKAQVALGFKSNVVFVIYVGIGCGAGWATSFHNSPAILFGLENIAECSWDGTDVIDGLIAHEVGHIIHKIYRFEAGLSDGSGPWWQLYTEGFAQRCEHIILGRESWHESIGINDSNWLIWCKKHKSRLAAEFLKTVEAGKSVRSFFGHWFDLNGKKQCGYFLGHELIKELQKNKSLREIAQLDDTEKRFKLILESVANEKTIRRT